jgi:hypothetical protein
MLVSPDTEDILEAISTLKNGASIVPENLDGAVSHMISAIGGDAMRVCAGKNSDFKRGFLICYAFCHDEKKRN